MRPHSASTATYPAAYRLATWLSALLLALLPLLARAGTPTLTLKATAPTTGPDVTAFVDQVEVLNASTGAVVASAVPNASFETFTNPGNTTYVYQPDGASWAFAKNSGIAKSSSPFGNPATSPDGSYVAFLQSKADGAGSFSQVLPTLAPGYYQVRVRLAQRNYNAANQGVAVLLGGVEVGRNVPANDGAFHTYTTAAFPLDQVLLSLSGYGNPGNTTANVMAFVDQVELLNSGSPVAGLVANAGFETTGSLGTNTYGYGPTGAGWEFASNSGIATNSSAFGNPTAPEGTHVAFIQSKYDGGSPNTLQNGSLQAGIVPLPASGSYTVRLQVAQRNFSLANQRVQVFLDGTLIGATVPANDGIFHSYTATTGLTVNLPTISGVSPASAGAGATITLAGNYLTGATYVSVDGLAVVPTSVGSTSLQFVLPANTSATPSLVVTTRFGLSNVSTALTVPLHVMSTSPAADAVAAPLANSAVAVTFSEPVTAASAAGIRVFSAQAGGRKTGTVTVSGSTASFAATAGPTSFKPGEKVRVTVPATVRNAGGQAAAPYVYQFTTATQPGLGTFGPSTSYPAGGAPEDVALGDLNNDGYLEMVVASGNALVVFPGQAGGSFDTPTTYPAPSFYGLVGVALADLNGDGRLDVVATDWSRSKFLVYLGQSGGDLAPATAYDATTDCTALTVGDLNGDGYLDVVGGFTHGIQLMQGQGNGALVDAGTYLANTFVRGVALGDVNGDGRLDLAATLYDNNQVAVLLGQASGGFGSPTMYPVGTKPYGVVLGDLNGDGLLDLATANKTPDGPTGTVSVLPGTRGGGFGPATTYAVGSQPNGLALGDVNGDGRPDLVTANTGSNSVSVLLGQAGGTFAPGVSYAAGLEARAVALADVDNDGRLDIVTADNSNSSSSPTASVLRGVVCVPVVRAQNAALLLAADGTATLAASAINNGSEADCGPAPAGSLRLRKPVSGSVSGDINENNYLTLTAPPGTVFTAVEFASFGTPTGTNGSYAIDPACHDPNSKAVVESYLLNQNTAMIPVYVGYFADQCPGTAKRLAVRATYSAIAQPTLTYSCAELGSQPVELSVTDSKGNVRIQTVTVTVSVPANLSATTWTGAAGTDWLDCANWSYGLVPAFSPDPNLSLDVTIPAGMSAYPSLPAGTYRVRSLTLAAGSRLSTAAGSALQVLGNWTDNGATTALAGGVAFTGYTGSAIGGAVGTTFSAVQVGKVGGSVCDLTQDLAIGSSLTLNSGVLNTNAYKVVLGTTATLSETDASYVTGTVQTTRPVSTPGSTQDFGGLGLRLTPAASSSTLPGSTRVTRATGPVLNGVGSSQSIRRYFDIQPATNAGLNVTMDFSYFDHERNGIAAANVRLFKSSNGTNGPWSNQGGTVSGNSVTRGGLTDFSLWTLGDANNPLPVQLVSFAATASGPAAVQLSWTTASEVNSLRFEVERSLDGAAWAPVGSVPAAGSSVSRRDYALLDGRPPAGASLLYYRLRQVDTDGSAHYSPVRAVPLGAVGVALYPNPAHIRATVTGLPTGAVVQVLDAVGRQVAQAAADATGTAQLALPAGLAAGVYVVRADGHALRLTVE